LSEVYRNSTQYVYLDIYGEEADSAPTATCVRDDVDDLVLTVQGPETVGDAQRWTAVIGFENTQDVDEMQVVWEFTINGVEASKTDFLDVVVPLAELDDIRIELDVPASISDDQIRRTERRVRRLIERITGQVFAPVEATLTATQLIDGSLRLPQKMLSLTSVAGVANSLYYVLANGGWALAILYPLKRDGIRSSGVPIIDPFAQYRKPVVKKVNVTGRWGYERVPNDVQEAALILIEQQLCPDSLYAERYLKTMTAADFRFEFDPGAYRGTGNVIADRLLSKYIPSGAAVI